jgi:hypothetical protein
MERTIPAILQWDENFDVGADTGTPVDDHHYRVPFRFSGKLEKLTPKIAPSVQSPVDRRLLQEQAWRNNRMAQ